MSDFWNKEENTSNQENVQDGGTMNQHDSQGESVNTTYHWVNPKLQENVQQEPIAYPQQEPVNYPQQEPVVYPQQAAYEPYQFSEPAQDPVKEKKSKAKKTKRTGGLGKKFAVCAAMAVVFGLIAGLTFQGINAIGGGKGTGESTDTQAKIESTETTADVAVDAPTQTAAASGEYSVEEVAANVMPSVVSISNASVQEVEGFFGGTEQYESESSGSGIIVGQNDKELLIATNNHVIAGAKEITVLFIDEQEVKGQIKGTDANNDLAVVSIKMEDIPKETQDKIKVATIGNSEELKVGEQVVAIGNALGYGQSVTSGYVSALNREVTVENVTANLIQTDAAINPGNSGGALLNMKGELIGINAVKFAASGVEGMGYAIPVATAEPILGDLMNRETRDKVDSDKASSLGITCFPVTAESAQMYNIPNGVFVAEVNKDSAAEKAGMKKGDVITKFGDATVGTYEELVSQLEYYAAGETVELVIQRSQNGEYKEQKVSVTLDKRADNVQE